MVPIRYKRGDIVCRKRLMHREFMVVIKTTKDELTCLSMSTATEHTYPKTEMHKYNIGHICVGEDAFKKIISGKQTIVYGPMSPAWKKITVSCIHPVPEIIKVRNAYGDSAYFEYIEAARVYFSETIKIKLQVGRKITSLGGS